MSAKTAKIVSYLTWIGLLIVLIKYLNNEIELDESLKQHMNQSLICIIAWCIPVGITQLVGTVFIIMAIVKICNNDETPLPLIGEWRFIK